MPIATILMMERRQGRSPLLRHDKDDMRKTKLQSNKSPPSCSPASRAPKTRFFSVLISPNTLGAFLPANKGDFGHGHPDRDDLGCAFSF